MSKRIWLAVLAGVSGVAGWLGMFPAQSGETVPGAWQQDLDFDDRARIADMVRGIDLSRDARKRSVDGLVAVGKGAGKDLVYESVIAVLQRTNPQARLAAVEIMARIGDPRYLPPMSQALICEPFDDVRMSSLRLLPSFMVGQEQLRNELLALLDADEYLMTARFREILRARPLRAPTWEIDPNAARVRKLVVAALSGQLDPVQAALPGLDQQSQRAASAKIIKEFLEQPLGETSQEAMANWAGRKATARYLRPELVEPVRNFSARLLGDIGAVEAWKELSSLSLVENVSARVETLTAMQSLARFAHERWGQQEAEVKGRDIPEAEAAWRKEERDQCANLVAATFATGVRLADNPDAAVRQSAWLAMGASRHAAALAALSTALERYGQEVGCREAVCFALGEIGGAASVRLLQPFAAYRGSALEGEARDGEYRAAESALKALGKIASYAGDEGAADAGAVLVAALADTREIPGHRPMAVLAMQELKSACGKKVVASSPAEWQEWLKERLANKASRPCVPAAEVEARLHPE